VHITTAPAGYPLGITGSHFGSTAGQVYIGSVQAQVTRWSDTSIEILIPFTPYYPYAGQVTVGTADGTARGPSFTIFAPQQPAPSAPFTLNGSAAQLGPTKFRLTTSGPDERGSVWMSAKQPVAGGFQTTFEFQITEPGFVGADGFAFVIQNVDAAALGDTANGGSGIGYSDLPNSLAVEFDTYRNDDLGDPNDHHISVHTNGVGPNGPDERLSLGLPADIPFLKDGLPHWARITYQPGILQVFVDTLTSAVVSVPIDLSNRLLLGDGTAWVGFTAATGADYETHDILVWGFEPD
jgi:hypothetical protein